MSTIDRVTAELEPTEPGLVTPAVAGTARLRPRRTPLTWIRNGGISRLLFLVPLLAIFGAFSWYPIVRLVLMSLQHTNLVQPATWVGFQNFSEVIHDPLFPIAVRNTAEFAGLALIFGYPIPLVVAVLMSEVRRRRGLYAALVYLPVVIPPVVAVLLWKFDWRYVLATLITVVVYMYYTYIATEWRIGIRRKMNDSDTEANTKAIDSLLNYETVKYFNSEQREAARYDRSMERYEQASVKAYTSLAVLNTGQAIIFTAGLTATMVMCAFGVRSGHNTVGDFVMVNAMMIQLYQPLNFMGMVYREIKQAIIDIEKMFTVLSRNPEIKDSPGAVPLIVTSGHVRFDNVQFAYEPDRPILKGLSFDVPAGKTVAIVGPSGAGKSTLFQLALRFYDPASGKVTLDGVDISRLDPASLRAEIALVPQDAFIFGATVADNIAYGAPGATHEAVVDAARQAAADSFIAALPQGYDTPLGERGVTLSGGERQRIAIARAILKDAPVLLLDEATSALDAESETLVQGALETLMKGRSTLVIAHRLATIVNAHRILVIEAGRLVEEGSHASLMAANGLYARLARLQFKTGAAALTAAAEAAQ